MLKMPILRHIPSAGSRTGIGNRRCKEGASFDRSLHFTYAAILTGRAVQIRGCQHAVRPQPTSGRTRPEFGGVELGGEHEKMSGVHNARLGAAASVLGTQFLPSQGAAGTATHAALAFTGFACGVYLVFAVGLILLGALLRRWGTAAPRG